MGILDEAIREHLELKRQHGADDSELEALESDAFGPADRPSAGASDASAEAKTEFMTQPDLDDEGDQGEAAGQPHATQAPEAPSRREPPAGLVDLQEAPPDEKPGEAQVEEEPGEDRAAEPPAEQPETEQPHSKAPSDEAQPAGEHETVGEPLAGGPNTEERHAIADQPTEMYDVEEQFSADEPAPSAEAPAPPDEDLVAEEISEPRLAPSEPIHDIEPALPADEEASAEPAEAEDEDFFSEQRLSDELDQALEAPVADEPESAEQEVVEEPRTELHQVVPEAEKSDQEKEHDALEETPDFLEQAPEDDELWFEQKPPKDFDFDD